MNGRIIAIGDIHGCHQEFAELLSGGTDAICFQLVLLGDRQPRADISRSRFGQNGTAPSRCSAAMSSLAQLSQNKGRIVSQETDEDTYERLRGRLDLLRGDAPYLGPICRPCSSMGDFTE
jgi:hypothetical protein